MISDRSTQGLFCSVLEFARTGPDCECDTPHTLVSRCSGARRVTDTVKSNFVHAKTR